jgi:hypothetical protein
LIVAGWWTEVVEAFAGHGAQLGGDALNGWDAAREAGDGSLIGVGWSNGAIG